VTPRRACLAVAVLAAAAPLPGQGTKPSVLPNRLVLDVAEDLSRPLARATLRLSLPPEPAGREGMAAFALETLARGAAGSHSRASFNRTLDHAGLILRRTLLPRQVVWELTGPPQALDAGLALLADQLLRPQVDGTAVERVRLRMAHALRASAPGARALQRARTALGAPCAPVAEEGFLSGVDQAEVEAYLRDLLRPDRASLRLEGSVAASQARLAAFHHFGTWPLPATALPTPPAPPSPRIRLVPGGASLAWLGVGLGDTPPAVREVLLLAAPGLAPLAEGLEIHPEGLALRSVADGPVGQLARLQARLDALAEQGLDAAAFEAVRRRHAARQAGSALHPADRARLGTDPAETARAVAALDRGAFNAELRRLLAPSRRQAVLVGVEAAAAADPGLAAFGPVEVWDAARAGFIRR
jgi:hypothetical protein